MCIALVSLNWAAADYTLGRTIAFFSGLRDEQHGAELVHVLDLKKKVDILNARRKRGELNERCAAMVLEMVHVSERYRPDRNMLAHGYLATLKSTGDKVLWSSSKLKALPLSELEAIRDEAIYAHRVAQQISFLIGGQRYIPELPPRPPERPPQP
jgi:hypothetical protein